MTAKTAEKPAETPADRLAFATPTDQQWVNVFMYGAPKSGKTIGAASAPGPILYGNADLPTATRLAHKQSPGKLMEFPIVNLDSLTAMATEVQEHPDDWNTVALDTVGDTYRRVLDGLSKRAISPSLPTYQACGVHIERFCRFMCEQPVNFVIIAHETAVKNDEEGGFERLPYTGTSNPNLGAKLMSMVDVIAYTGVKTDDNGTQYLSQLVDGAGRRGGDRFKVLGPGRETNLSEWFDVIAKAEEATA